MMPLSFSEEVVSAVECGVDIFDSSYPLILYFSNHFVFLMKISNPVNAIITWSALIYTCKASTGAKVLAGKRTTLPT